MHFKGELQPEDILITSDTIVAVDGDILGKPKDKAEAIKMLRELSGRTHHVVTGVCLRSTGRTLTFSDTCEVTFDILSDEDIDFYIDQFKPFDKAGAYGIQEWIGLSNIKSISGSVYTVIGLPVQKLYKALLEF
jgi:septum formation protein